MWTLEGAKEHEKTICSLLNKEVGKFKLAKDQYSVFDIHGRDDINRPVMVEIKQRKEWYPEMYIENNKLLSMFKEGNKNPDKNTVYLLICSVGDDHRVYDCKDIWTLGRHTEREMNANTVNGSKKVSKKVVAFKHDSNVFDLTTLQLGHNYEFIN